MKMKYKIYGIVKKPHGYELSGFETSVIHNTSLKGVNFYDR